MGSHYLPSIGDLTSWDDPILLTQPPFQDAFASWKLHYQVGSTTRAEKMSMKKQLVADLSSAGIQSRLQHWVDLAFNSSPSDTAKSAIKADDRALQFFVDIQWALFSKNDKVFEMLSRECRQRGAQYVSASVRLGPVKKRKAQTAPRKETQKRPKIDLMKKPTIVRAPAQSVAIAPLKATPGVAITKDVAKRRPAATQVRNTRAKLQKTVIKAGMVKALTFKRRQIDLYPAQPRSTRAGTRRHRAENAALGALRHKERKKRLKRKKEPKNHPPKPAKGGPIVPLVVESHATPENGCPGLNNQQDSVLLPAPSAGTPRLLKDSNCEPLPREPPCLATSHISEIKDQGDVKPPIPSPLLPRQSSSEPVPNWLQEFTNESQLIRPIKSEYSQQAIPPVSCPPIVKPPLPDYPPIWAQSRQEVCESFDWFRSYQGGVYHARNVARGYLLSAFSARRDIFCHGGKLIISHGGGKAQSVHSRQGQHIAQEADDQLAQDKSVRALLENYRSRRPIVLLIDDKYAQFPYDLGLKDITYAALGFYTIVHAWAEYQPAVNERGRVIRYKFAFQWCESQGDPWWLRFGSSGISEERGLGEQSGDEPECVEQSFAPFEHIEEISTRCLGCHESSAQVYENLWTCLNPDCSRFWRDAYNRLLGDDLQYNPRFLRLAPANSLAIPAEKLEPRLPGPSSPGLTTDYAYTRGWHCKDCGRLSCRYKWEHWECMHCKTVLKTVQRTRKAMEFLFLTPPVSFKEVFLGKDSGIERLVFKVFDPEPHDGSFGQCFTYRLPEGRGFIHHIKTGNPFWNKEADEIFEEYQEQASTGALPFRRWPMRAHKCRGALLTNYFSQNAGVPYQYVGGTENTLPFDEVPNAVVRARDLIQTRVKQALGRNETFNEVLSAAYMERQRMAFHTDDEIGLGPLVAGLSLGSPALMHFRLLARHTPEGVPRSIAISFVLRHGDVLAMDGAGVQQFYEHTVVPTNFRIAATARYINTTHPKREKSS